MLYLPSDNFTELVIKTFKNTSFDKSMVPISQQRRDEVERAAMNVALAFERNEGRVPEDVSQQNLGWDITSRGASGERYIEVKGHVRKGLTIMSQNEMKSAKKHRNRYFLYVVFYAEKRKKLCIKRNPADTTSPEIRIEYRIKPAAIEG